MKQEDFEKLVEDAGLNLLSNYRCRFIVSLRVRKPLLLENGDIVSSERIQCEVLAYQPAEFFMLTPERAQQQIEACKAQLERAAQTKQGNIASDRAKKPAVKKESKVGAEEAYLKAMRKRGEMLAKTRSPGR
jgi:hypothetical protein